MMFGDKAMEHQEVFMILFAYVEAFVNALFLMLSWNYVLPVLFNLPQVTFLQALGLVVMSCCLFGKRAAEVERENLQHREMIRLLTHSDHRMQ